MNGWQRIATSVIGGLALAGIIGAISVWGQQRDIKKDVDSNRQSATMCCDKAGKNQTDITVLTTEWRIFQLQYAKDQERAASERKEILEAIKK